MVEGSTTFYERLPTDADLAPSSVMWAFNLLGWTGPEFHGAEIHYSHEDTRYIRASGFTQLFTRARLVLDDTLSPGEWYVEKDGKRAGSSGV